MEEKIDYGDLPTIEESLGDERNSVVKTAWPKDLWYEDQYGYQRFKDTHCLIINKDGSARKATGLKPSNNTTYAQNRAERRAQRRMKMLENEADIKMRDLLKRLDRNYFDVVMELIDIYELEETSVDQRLRILFKLMDHAYPKLSVLNTNEKNSDGFVFNIELGGKKKTKDEKKRAALEKEIKKQLQ